MQRSSTSNLYTVGTKTATIDDASAATDAPTPRLHCFYATRPVAKTVSAGLDSNRCGHITSSRWLQRDEQHCEFRAGEGHEPWLLVKARHSNKYLEVTLPTIAEALARLDRSPSLVARPGPLHPVTVRGKQERNRPSPAKSTSDFSLPGSPINTDPVTLGTAI